MIPILYEANETSFTTNGLGRLSDAVSCTVIEERNGIYELEMEYPVSGIHFSDIDYERIISAVPADGKNRQPFRIYQITKPMDGVVTVYAEHISYQLAKATTMPCEASSPSAALANIANGIVGENRFTFWTDKNTAGNFELKTPSQVRSVLGGTQGSVLDVYGGEYEFDGYIVRLWNSRGSDKGVTLRYGKNLTQLNDETDYGNVYTGIVPYWADDKSIVTLPEKAVYSGHQNEYTHSMNIPMDFSSDFKEKPTVEQLREKAQAYVTNQNGWIPKNNIKVSFVALWQTDEYSDVALLQRVNLCDIVSVYHPTLGISAKAKVIKTTYNVLLDRYNEIELGDAHKSLAKTITDGSKEELDNAINQSYSFMDEAIKHATELIKGGLGGHVVINTDADGKPQEILIMDTEDINTAVKVLRMNINGIGFSSDGYDGTFRTAWTLDGHFVADFIASGTLRSILIQGCTMVLGGKDNGNGTLAIKNASGFNVVYADKDGIDITRGTVEIGSDTSNIVSVVSKDGIEVHAGDNYGISIKRVEGGVDFAIEGNFDGHEYMYFDTQGKLKAKYVYDRINGTSANVCVHSDGEITKIGSSSRRYKHDITDSINEELDPRRLYELPVVQFKYNDGYLAGECEWNGKDVIGFISEDVDSLYPIACEYEDGQPESWNDRALIPAMLKLIQEQNERIKRLEEQLK